MAAENKTKPTKISVTAHLAAIADETRRADCKKLAALMKRVTGCAPKMWGASIVGFDQYRYRYDSGREGEMCAVGFAAGTAQISVYLMMGFEDEATKALLGRLGKHKTGKACLYIKRLADIDMDVLEQLVELSVEDVRRRYPDGKD
ncbi:MAG: DUF1801 domain-containing protein [Planctomycetota bacterium]